MRPATRIGRCVIFPGGHTVRLSRLEQLLFALGPPQFPVNQPQQQEVHAVSFWDTHDAGSGGGGYLTPDEKAELVDSEQPFDITAVRYEAENKFGPRFVVTLTLPNPATGDNETRMVGFPHGSGVTSRDDLLQAMIDDHFGAGEKAPIPAVLAKGGNSFLIKPAP